MLIPRLNVERPRCMKQNRVKYVVETESAEVKQKSQLPWRSFNTVQTHSGSGLLMGLVHIRKYTSKMVDGM